MGWIILVALAAALALLLWKFGRFRGACLQLLAAALLAAMAGYAWQGQPGLRGEPRQQAVRAKLPETVFASLRGEFLEEFDYASRWLILADSYQRRGASDKGVGILRSGIRASPNNMSLWTGLGNALVIHGGAMNPAAELAYRRAMALSPDHPAPRFFYGSSLIQSGRLAEGERVWHQLLAGSRPDASWRPLVEERLAVLQQLRAIQQQRDQAGTAPAR